MPKPRTILKYASGACALLLAFGLLASPATCAAGEAALTPPQRAQAIEDIAAAFEKIYVFPYIGNAVARDLRTRLRHGEYDQVSDSRALAELLSAQIDAICHDAHTSVAYMEEDQLAVAPARDPEAPKRRAEVRLAKARADNFGFARPERLDGNVAYIKFDGFYSADLAAPTIAHIMSEAASASAVIFDVRDNGGGSPEIIALLASYLFDDQPVHLYDRSDRHDGTSVAAWTNPAVAGARLGSSKPVFVLTSKRTFSAAENFAYTLQQLKRAQVVGEQTGGGAHGAFGRPVTAHLVPMIATVRTINAVSGTDWDRTGVVPDTPARDGDALNVALQLARRAIAQAGIKPAAPPGTATSPSPP